MTATTVEELREMEVEKYGRGLYWVSSKSRYNKRHLVDVEGFDEIKEPIVCNCEAFRYHHHRPCHHILRVILHRIECEMTDEERLEALAKIKHERRTSKKTNRRR